MEIPEGFYCPITLEIMRDPVIDPDGISYERSAIEAWLQKNQISPVTRNALTKNDLRPNRSLKETIEMIMKHLGRETEVPVVVNVGVEEVQGVEEVEVVVKTDGVGFVMCEVSPPDLKHRAPCDLCCIVDISGSMGEEATMKNSSGEIETHGLSLLDITKHAVKTIIYNLHDMDRLSLVAYSSQARVVFDLMEMNESGKEKAVTALSALVASGQTNIWDGLSKGLDCLSGDDSKSHISSLLLFTDGLPNISPPRGELAMLQRYRVRNKGYPGTINTFGFGYSLDSVLLNNIAIEGNGAYAFIPDSSLVGTVFVNALSNILSTMSTDTVLALSTDNSNTFQRVLGGTPHDIIETGDIHINIGNLRYGQKRSFVISSELGYHYGQFLSGTLTYNHIGSGTEIEKDINGVEYANPESLEIETLRLRFIDTIREAMEVSSDIVRSQQLIEELIYEFKNSPLYNETFVSDLFLDLNGEVQMAFSDEDSYQKWGRHYLPSLISAHLLQQCNNFKDPGVQHYGGSLFKDIRDIADDIFISIPVPKPSIKTPTPIPEPTKSPHTKPTTSSSSTTSNNTSRRSYRPISSMSTYYSNSVPCFDGKCTVLMENGILKNVESIARNDLVATQDGISKVICVIKTLCYNNKTELVVFPNGLKITPWHPIRINGEWAFPNDIKQSKIRTCPAVYSFILESGHTMFINNTECCTLGHNMKGPIISHSYLGTDRVINDLKSHPSYPSGLITMMAGSLLRDPKTNHITGFKTTTQQEIQHKTV